MLPRRILDVPIRIFTRSLDEGSHVFSQLGRNGIRERGEAVHGNILGTCNQVAIDVQIQVDDFFRLSALPVCHIKTEILSFSSNGYREPVAGKRRIAGNLAILDSDNVIPIILAIEFHLHCVLHIKTLHWIDYGLCQERLCILFISGERENRILHVPEYY